jgi:hypothetical protein
VFKDIRPALSIVGTFLNRNAMVEVEMEARTKQPPQVRRTGESQSYKRYRVGS